MALVGNLRLWTVQELVSSVLLCNRESIQGETVRNVCENFQYLDMGIFVHILSGRKQMDFEKLYKEYYKEVYYVCLKYMKNEDDAADMAHDTFVKAYERIDQIKDKTKIKAWMCKIASTTCLDRLRHNNIIQFDSADDNEELIQIEDKAAIIPEKMAIEKDVQEILLKVIGKLSEPQRVCVVMYYYELLTIKEIAERLECPEQTVRSRLNYAKKAMKEEVERLEDKGVAIRCVGILPFLYLVFRAEFTQMDAAVPAVEGVLEGINTSSGNANSVSTEPEGGISDAAQNSGKGEVESGDATTKSDLAAVKNKVKLPLASKIVVGIATIAVVGGVVSFLANNNHEKSPSTNKEMENVVEDKNNESSGKEESTKDNKPVEDVETQPEELLKFKSYTEVEYIGNTVSNLNNGDCREVDAGEYIYFSDSSCENGEETYDLYSYAKDSGKTEIIYSDSKVNFTGLNFCDGMIICALGNKYDDSPRTLAKFDVKTKELVEMKNNGKTIMISAITNPVVVNDWIYYIDDKEQLCKIDLLGNDYALLESEACYYLCPIRDRVVYELDSDMQNFYYITLDGKSTGKIKECSSDIIGTSGDKIYYGDFVAYYRMNYDGTDKEYIQDFSGDLYYQIKNITDDYIYYTHMYQKENESGIYQKLYRSKIDKVTGVNNIIDSSQELTIEHGAWMKNQLVMEYNNAGMGVDNYWNSIFILNEDAMDNKDMMVYTKNKETVNINLLRSNLLDSSSIQNDVCEINELTVIDDYLFMDSFLKYNPIELINENSDEGSNEHDIYNSMHKVFVSKPISVREIFDSNNNIVNYSEKLCSSIVEGKGVSCIVSYDMLFDFKKFEKQLTDQGMENLSVFGISTDDDGLLGMHRWYSLDTLGSYTEDSLNVFVVDKDKNNKYVYGTSKLRTYCLACLEGLAYMEIFMKNWYMNNGHNNIDEVQPRLRYSGTTNLKLRDESKYQNVYADRITSKAFILNEQNDKAAVVVFARKVNSDNNSIAGNEKYFFDIVYAEKIDNVWYVSDNPDKILEEVAEQWIQENQNLLVDTSWIDEYLNNEQFGMY